MAENLNYEAEDSYCYDDTTEYCSKYGRLYSWAGAMDSVGMWSKNSKDCGYGKICNSTYPVRGVCPEGWHLPTRAEWNTLFDAVGGDSVAVTMLKSTSGWNDYDEKSSIGTDSYSFSALPAGFGNDFGNYIFEGQYAFFWSSTEYGHFSVYEVYLDNDGSAGVDKGGKEFAASVRCVKDDE
jgi:Fibrobacter succinogenes major domain (Fib_succ_major).